MDAQKSRSIYGRSGIKTNEIIKIKQLDLKVVPETAPALSPFVGW